MTVTLYAIEMIDGWSSDSIAVSVGAGYPVSEASTVYGIPFETNTDTELSELFGLGNTMTLSSNALPYRYFFSQGMVLIF